MPIHGALGPRLFQELRSQNAFLLDLLVDTRVVVEIESINVIERS
jgi:hypothetical protein